MKTFFKTSIGTAVLLLLLSACENPLQEETFSELGPTNFYNTAEDAETLLNGVYAESQGSVGFRMREFITFDEFTTDIAIERGGGINAQTQPIEDFEWQSTHPWLDGAWSRHYSAIFRANLALDRVPGIEMNPERKEVILAEARFLRAMNYYYLYRMWGATPLVTSSETSIEDRPERPSEDEFISFVETELVTASENLPAVQQEYGRATSGAALAFLTRLYLNNKQWSEAATTAAEIINNGQYSLFTEGNRAELLAVKNEGHPEFIFVIPAPADNSTGVNNNYLAHAAPPGYRWTYPPGFNFAANFKIRSEFLELFYDPDDERLNAFVFEYVNMQGDTIQLGEDDVRSFKFPEDPNSVGFNHGNDFPLVRYADILLSRAEALNEMNGPNPESIALINQVRMAANADPIELSDFSSITELRDFILDERGREFHTEALRRTDLIRHGKFIEFAQERGHPATEKHLLFPIPQSEIDRNPALEQNPGY